MTYEEMMRMIQTGGDNAGLQQDMARQLEQAKALQGQAPQMRQAGNVAVAPHWMEMLGMMARENAAKKMRDSADVTGRQINQNKQAQFAKLLQSMQMGQPSAPAAGPGFQLPKPQGMGITDAPSGGGLNYGM